MKLRNQKSIETKKIVTGGNLGTVSRGGTKSSVPSGRWQPGHEVWGSAPEGSRQAALEKPGPNSSSPVEGRSPVPWLEDPKGCGLNGKE